jgi:hypothetical protein
MGRRPFSSTRAPNATAVSVALALVAAAIVPCGCSFLFSAGAPDNHRALESFQCGDSYAPPVVDTVVGGLLAFGAIGAAANEDKTVAKANPVDQPQVRRDTNVGIGVAIAFAVADAAGAIYGYHAAGDCREAQATRLAEVSRARVLPPPYGVPPSGEPPLRWPPPHATTPYAPPAATPSGSPATPSP